MSDFACVVPPTPKPLLRSTEWLGLWGLTRGKEATPFLALGLLNPSHILTFKDSPFLMWDGKMFARDPAFENHEGSLHPWLYP